MTPLEGASTRFQITKSQRGSVFAVRARLNAMDEDFGARAGPALGFLDETGAIRIHPGESFPQGRAELGFADPAVIVRIDWLRNGFPKCASPSSGY